MLSGYVVGQILTCVSYIVFWVSRYMKDKNTMLLYDNVSRFFAVVAFMCLETYDGIKNTLFVVVRNIVGSKITDKKKKIKAIAFVIMLTVLFLLYASNIGKISTICVFICGMFNLYGVVMCREQGIRICGLLGSGFYAAFLFTTKNYTGFICEIICAVVMFTSYCKYRKEAKVE